MNIFEDDNKKIRVLQVLNSLGRGGIESIVTGIHRQIHKEKIQFDYCIMDGKPTDHLDEVIQMGAKVYVYPPLNTKTIFKFIGWWKRFFQEHHEYDIVHGHVFTTAAIYLYYAHKNGMKTIVHSHNTNIAHANRSRVELFFRKLLLQPFKYVNWIDKRLACSLDAGRWLFGKKPFEIMNNAVDIKKFQFDLSQRDKTREDLGLKDELLVGHVGNGTEAKNHKFIVDVFKELHDKNPRTKLILIGDLSQREEAIKAYVREQGIEDATYIVGKRQDIPALMCAMDCFLFPSIYEGLGIVLIEAQACGLPCVVSDSVPHEADRNIGLVSWLSLKDNTKEWSRQLLTAKADKQRQQYSELVAESGYSIERVAEFLCKIYTQIQEQDAGTQ